ncbi:recombinase family protein [Microbacterium paludicola]|uniref:recombinase family protein n=1 Tax=Microbacterium paludicola TaxID=300019 RepID=UPI0031DCB4AB
MNRDLYGYLRVSKADVTRPTSLSIDAQRTAILAHAEAKGDRVVRWFEDDGVSGATADRPGLNDMLAALTQPRRPGKKRPPREADGIVAAKLDRLSRSIVNFGDLLETSRKHRWSITVLDFDLDTRTAVGRMVAGFLILFAQFERELIGERTSAALQEAKRRGVKLGRPRTLPATSERRVLDLHAAGLTLSAISDRLNAEGTATGRGGRWHPSTVARILERNAPHADKAVA